MGPKNNRMFALELSGVHGFEKREFPDEHSARVAMLTLALEAEQMHGVALWDGEDAVRIGDTEHIKLTKHKTLK